MKFFKLVRGGDGGTVGEAFVVGNCDDGKRSKGRDDGKVDRSKKYV